MINYTKRVGRFSTSISLYCAPCWSQTKSYNFKTTSTLAVPEDKILFEPFFGVDFGPGEGSSLGTTPNDKSFQKKVYQAMITHNRNAHPQNICRMVNLGWIKK